MKLFNAFQRLFNAFQRLIDTITGAKSDAKPATTQAPQDKAEPEMAMASRGGRAPSGPNMPRRKRPTRLS